MPQNSTLLLPAQDSVRREFHAVVTDHRRRTAATSLDDAIELAADLQTQRRLIGDETRHSWGEVIDIASNRSRRPLASASDTKSSDQRWFAAPSYAIGDRVPNARFRSPRLRTPSRSSR